MGYPRILDSAKLEAVSYVVAGLTQSQAAKRLDLNSKSVSRWMKDTDLVAKATAIVEKAKVDATRRKRGKVVYERTGLARMTRAERKEAARKGGFARWAKAKQNPKPTTRAKRRQKTA